MKNENAINILNSLKQYYNDKTEHSYVGFDDDDNEAIDTAIKVLEQTRWIPVSERLPENHKDVLIYLSSNQICIGFYNSHRLPFSNNVIGWGSKLCA